MSNENEQIRYILQYLSEVPNSPDKSVIVLNKLSSVPKIGHGRRSRRSRKLLNKVLFRHSCISYHLDRCTGK